MTSSSKLARRQFVRLTAGSAALACLPRIARALSYPVRPVRIVVGFPAGSTPEIVARVIGHPLSERLGQKFVAEARPGAGTNIATELVVRATPDGYTLLMAVTTNAINVSLYPNLAFSFVRDIVPVAMIGGAPFVMVVSTSFPAKTVPEFIAYAKANPGKVNMASPGIGTTAHFAGELLRMMTGIDLVHVPYRSSYMPDLLGGQVHVVFSSIPQLIEQIRIGKLRALGVTSATRVDVLPEIPTIGEFVPGYESSGWIGIGAPKNTPSPIVEKLNAEINAVTAVAGMRARLVDLGVEPVAMTPPEFGRLIAAESQKWAKVVQFADVRPE